MFLLALQYLFQTNVHLLPCFKLQSTDIAEDQPANFFARPSVKIQYWWNILEGAYKNINDLDLTDVREELTICNCETYT